ncbi:uncharacterized protein LOC114337279 isoform X3 [Diabrotica virgifera virgifera]|uniref:Uncharacterized protein LOC114337279 isoform X2 n=1 Tax=Diabrotica virgifera virgifera TaxID=50390 RepID=A0A6P7GI79_DIAVI|nr:uncharacterized protein LOC114337279 isoform X3 [Diabrotica virgifera virgifera]
MSDSKKRKMELSTPEEVITKFHNLDGDLIGERKKCFFTLLKTASQNLTPTEIDYVIDNLNPKSYQQKLFYVYAIVYFKKTERLIQVLKDCNRDHIKIVMQQHWFIEEAFKDMAPNTLVNEFFPEVSYSTRLKLLNRITRYWSEEKNDELFSCLQQRYGSSVALRTLSKSSTKNLLKILKQHEIILNSDETIRILNEPEDIVRTYFNHYFCVRKNAYCESPVINVLALRHLKLFLELEASKKICIKRLSNAATVHMITFSKEAIIDSPRYLRFLNLRAVVKCFGSDFTPFYKKTLPLHFEEFNVNLHCFQILKYVPKNIRWELFTNAFHTNYPNRSIDDLFLALDFSINKLNPSKEVILKWAETNYKITDDDKYLEYYCPIVSLPLIKEKINFTASPGRRLALLKILVSTCAYNKDMKSLDKVLEYIGTRHKNENSLAYKKLIEFIINKFSENELSKNHWIFINQQLTLIRTVDNVMFHDTSYLMVNVLDYFCNNDKDMFKTILFDYMKEASTFNWWFFENYLLNPSYREIFIECCKMLPQLEFSSQKCFREVHRRFIKDFVTISERNPEQPLNIFEYPWFVSAMEYDCNTKDQTITDNNLIQYAIRYNICVPQHGLSFINDTKLTEILEVLYKGNMYKFCNFLEDISRKPKLTDLEKRIVVYSLEKFDLSDWYYGHVLRQLIVYHPRLLLSTFDTIFPALDYKFEIKVVKQYSHIELDKKICQNIFKLFNKLEPKKLPKAIDTLIDLLPSEELVEFVNSQLNASRNTSTLDSQRNSHQIIKCIATSLKEVAESKSLLPFILELCEDSLTEEVLPSLYSLFYRCPENLLHVYYSMLLKKSNFEQKHVIHLIVQLTNQNVVIEFLKQQKPDLNVVGSTLKCCSMYNFDVLFPIAKQFLSTLKPYEKSIFSTISDTRVTINHRAEYIEACWKILEMVEDNKTNKYFDQLLKSVMYEEVVKSFSKEFVDNVLIKYFPIQEKNRQNIDNFIVHCLAFRTQERHLRLETIFKGIGTVHMNIFSFCKKIVDLNNELAVDLLRDIIEYWKQSTYLLKTLDSYILLNLVLIQRETSEKSHGSNIGMFLDKLLVEYNYPILKVFINLFKKQIHNHTKLTKFELLYSILKYKVSPENLVLVLRLIDPISIDDSTEHRIVYNNIMDKIKLSEAPIVKCYYHIYLETYGLH